MYKYFENLVDPYTSYAEDDAPPRRLWPFLKRYLKPFHKVLVITGVFSIITAFVEIGLIWYLGRIVDLLEVTGTTDFWSNYGLEMALAGGFLLLVRPVLQGVSTGLINNTILPNFGTLIRWRAHRHVLRQSAYRCGTIPAKTGRNMA